MVRPHSCRRVTGQPGASIFKPAGIPGRVLDRIVMTLDEFEAIRLADAEGLQQEEAAAHMQVSRPTFGRILESAHRKLAQMLVQGLALHIEGGPVHTGPWHGFACRSCDHEWLAPRPASTCPRCRGHDLERRSSDDRPPSESPSRRRLPTTNPRPGKTQRA